MSKCEVFSGPYFPVFGLNTEIYRANIRIPSEYRKIRTRKTSASGHFSRSVMLMYLLSNRQALFKAQFMKRLSNSEAELKKSFAYKKSVHDFLVDLKCFYNSFVERYNFSNQLSILVLEIYSLTWISS